VFTFPEAVFEVRTPSPRAPSAAVRDR